MNKHRLDIDPIHPRAFLRFFDPHRRMVELAKQGDKQAQAFLMKRFHAKVFTKEEIKRLQSDI